MSPAKQIMREYLRLNAEEKTKFNRLIEELADAVRHADNLPARHPDKASRRWKAVKHFIAQHDL